MIQSTSGHQGGPHFNMTAVIRKGNLDIGIGVRKFLLSKPPSLRYFVTAATGNEHTCHVGFLYTAAHSIKEARGLSVQPYMSPKQGVTSDHLGCIYGLEARPRPQGQRITQGWDCQEGSLGHTSPGTGDQIPAKCQPCLSSQM